MAETYSAGIVTAYGAAVRGGYTGTYEEFCAEQAGFAENAEQVAQDREAMETLAGQFSGTTVPAAVQTVQNAGAAQIQAVESASETEQQQIAAAGAAQETRVTQAGDDQVDAVEEAGTTQVGNVNAAGTTQVGAVNTAGATQVQAVEDKGQEVIGSIPADYTELTEDVADLKSALIEVKSDNLFDFDAVIAGKTIDSNGDLIDSASNSTSAVMECAPGDTVYIVSVRNGSFYKDGNASARWFAIYDANMTLLSRAEYANNVEITNADAKFFRLVFTNSALSNTTKLSVTINARPESAAEIRDYYDYFVNSAADTRIALVDYLPADFRRERKCADTQTYINQVIAQYGNNRFSIVLPEGELSFSGTAYLPYKVAIYASQGTIINVADNVTAFEWSGETYPMASIYDGDGCAFDGGGCRFLLGSGAIGLKINGANADSNTAFARRNISNVVFKGSDKSSVGIYYVPRHVYLIKHDRLQFSNTVCIQWGDNNLSAVDSGENMSFIGCAFTHIPFYITTFSLSVRCVCCSFDYCEALSVRLSGNTAGLIDAFIADCHFERNKTFGGDGLILRGNATFFTQPNSNAFDVPPFAVKLGNGSNVALRPATSNADAYNCVVMSSPYLRFAAPRKPSDMLLNTSRNLSPSGYNGASEIKVFHQTNYIGIYASSEGSVTFTDQLTGAETTFAFSGNRIYGLLPPGIYAMTCSGAVSDMIINDLE